MHWYFKIIQICVMLLTLRQRCICLSTESSEEDNEGYSTISTVTPCESDEQCWSTINDIHVSHQRPTRELFGEDADASTSVIPINTESATELDDATTTTTITTPSTEHITELLETTTSTIITTTEGPSTNMPITTTTEGPIVSNCPSGFSFYDNFCYSFTKSTTYSNGLCPFVGNIFVQNAWDYFNKTVWFSGSRKNSSFPFTSQFHNTYGDQIRNHESSKSINQNCLIYQNSSLIPVACTDNYEFLCLYDLPYFRDYGYEFCSKTNPTAEYCFAKTFDFSECFCLKNGNHSRTEVCKENQLAEPQDKFQASILFSLYHTMNECWIGLKKSNAKKYIWESTNKEIDSSLIYLITDNTSSIYGTSTNYSWGFKDLDENIKCGICETLLISTNSTVTITLRAISNKSAIDGTVNNFDNVFNHFVYCFIGSKNHEYSVKQQINISGQGKFKLNLMKQSSYYYCEAFEVPSKKIVMSNTMFVASSWGEYAMNVSSQLPAFSDPFRDHIPDFLDGFNTDPDGNTVRPMLVDFEESTGKFSAIYHITSSQNFSDEDLMSIFGKYCEGKNVILNSIRDCFKCPQEIVEIGANTNLTWSSAYIGQTILPLELCVNSDYTPVTRTCLGDFVRGAYWSETKGKCDGLPTDETKELHGLLNDSVPIQEVEKSLNNITTKVVKSITVLDTHYTALVLQRIASDPENSSSDIFKSVNNILQSSKTVLGESQLKLNSTDIILDSVDGILLNKIPKNTGSYSKIIVKSISILGNSTVTGLSLYNRNNDIDFTKFAVEEINSSITLEDVKKSNPDIAVLLSKSVINQLDNFFDGSNLNLIVTFLYNNVLFNEITEVQNQTDGYIVSILIPGFNEEFQDPGIHVLFKSKYENLNEKICSHWKYGFDEEVSIRGSWFKDELLDSETSNIIICNFTHLTHFSMLVTDKDFDSFNDKILSIITIFGCVLSGVAILIILATAIVFKSWRKEKENIILLNYVASISLVFILLFVGNNIPPGDGCKASGIILHYSILAHFCWMCVISYFQYRRYVVVIQPFRVSRLVLKTCLVGWGVPLLPIVIVMASSLESYGKSGSDQCYVNGLAFKLGLLLPIVVVLTINISFFAVIMYSVTRTKSKSLGRKTNDSNVVLKLAFFLIFLLGISWIFGILVAIDGPIVFSYLFSLTSGLQGFVVCLFFITSAKFKKYWFGFKKQQSSKSGVQSAVSTDLNSNSYRPFTE